MRNRSQVGNRMVWALVLSMAFVAAATAETLDTSVFLRKRTVTLSGYTGNSTLTDFPVLVRLPTAVFSLKII